MQEKKVKVYISAASLLPFSWGPWGPALSIWLAKRFGFDGVQALPMRGWSKRWLQGINPNDIGTIDIDAWNSGTFLEALWRSLKKAFGRDNITLENHPPLLMDWFLFGNKGGVIARQKALKKQFVSKFFIGHIFRKGEFLEINPEVLMHYLKANPVLDASFVKDRFLELIVRDLNVVLDPYHSVGRSDYFGKDHCIFGEKELATFPLKFDPQRVKAIHINPSWERGTALFEEWLAYGVENDWNKMMQNFKSLWNAADYEIPIVVEVTLKYLLLGQLSKIQQKVRKSFE